MLEDKTARQSFCVCVLAKTELIYSHVLSKLIISVH